MSTDFLASLEAHSQPPVAARIRQRLKDIEVALARGFTHRQIREQLNREGIVLTAAYYNRLIPRLRREARSAKSSVAGAPGRDKSHQSAPLQGDKASESLMAATAELDAAGSPKRADLSAAIAPQALVRPRTIPTVKPAGTKFSWDPKGAEKIDPNKM